MGGRKRKPTGVTGLIGGVIGDQQKARERTRRIEQQAAAAREKAAAKSTAPQQREQAVQERQEPRDNELATGLSEAEAVNHE